MKTYKTQVTALETTFDVEYWASKGYPGTYFEPPDPPELEIVKITIGDQMLDGLLSDFTVDEIYKSLEKQLDDCERQCEEDMAESMSESWTE